MIKTFTIRLPSDGEGFIGRACDAVGCKQYFKLKVSDHRDTLHCPYCGTGFSRNQLLTRDQLAFARKAATEQARVYAIQRMQDAFKNALRGSKFLKYKPGPRPQLRLVKPQYSERKVDTELTCADCGTQFQVYGIFGYCPGCRCENLMIYDTNWAIIKGQLNGASDEERQLRHAYGDLVSTFETFCTRKASTLTAEQGNFQVLFDARKFFKTHADIDILANIAPDDLLALRRLFQKRHVCIHAGGVITDRYVRMIPEDLKLLGCKATLSVPELETAAAAMRTALCDLVRKIELPG